jgi:hypothetical protein
VAQRKTSITKSISQLSSQKMQGGRDWRAAQHSWQTRSKGIFMVLSLFV